MYADNDIHTYKACDMYDSIYGARQATMVTHKIVDSSIDIAIFINTTSQIIDMNEHNLTNDEA